MGQIHSILAGRVQGMFSSDIEKNPNEQLNAIMLRTSKEFKVSRKAEETKEKAEDMKLDRTNNASTQCLGTKPELENKAQDVKKDEASLSYPHRVQKQRLDKQFGKFTDMFRTLHINIPFVDMLEQMPKYAKFLKEIITHKKRFEEHEMVMLTEEGSALLQKKLPLKLKDPASFNIPGTIGSFYFDKALCDLGASINLMPFSIFRKLGLGEVKPILDMEEDRNIPLILGRHFLATSRTLIDVHQGKLILRVEDEQVEFNVFNTMKCPSELDTCFEISILDDKVVETLEENCPSSPLENCLVNSRIMEVEFERVDEQQLKPYMYGGLKDGRVWIFLDDPD
ncbi:uncharacterized protein LOC116119031 [Pistacia vera]|uniref:uncharacterized protein LOC116119031 n=1 Tax=Pistacia vera TaxID=55513 RepID=UPI0012635E6E|nr:uncharacterized protein LOC116119031 [Pistacia vera]